MRDALVIELLAEHTDPPTHIGDLSARAAQEILRLRAIVARYRGERQYIIGFNDGYDSAIENSNSAEMVIDANG